MLELAIIAVIVAGATAYALWALTPATTRLRLARRLAAWGGEQGRSASWVGRLTAAIERAADKRQAAACGGCSVSRPEEPKIRQPPKR
jgi:hypothetical protein